jgi:hypothetical protein
MSESREKSCREQGEAVGRRRRGCQMSTGRMSAGAGTDDREASLLDSLGELVDDERAHVVVPVKAFGRRRQIEACAGAEVPRVVLAGEVGAARRGVGEEEAERVAGSGPDEARLPGASVLVAG